MKGNTYYLAICYSPQLAKSAGFENQTMAAESLKFSILDIFDQLVAFYSNNYSSLPHGL